VAFAFVAQVAFGKRYVGESKGGTVTHSAEWVVSRGRENAE
jgi:hypothetical protein